MSISFVLRVMVVNILNLILQSWGVGKMFLEFLVIFISCCLILNQEIKYFLKGMWFQLFFNQDKF